MCVIVYLGCIVKFLYLILCKVVFICVYSVCFDVARSSSRFKRRRVVVVFSLCLFVFKLCFVCELFVVMCDECV